MIRRGELLCVACRLCKIAPGRRELDEISYMPQLSLRRVLLAGEPNVECTLEVDATAGFPERNRRRPEGRER